MTQFLGCFHDFQYSIHCVQQGTYTPWLPVPMQQWPLHAADVCNLLRKCPASARELAQLATSLQCLEPVLVRFSVLCHAPPPLVNTLVPPAHANATDASSHDLHVDHMYANLHDLRIQNISGPATYPAVNTTTSKMSCSNPRTCPCCSCCSLRLSSDSWYRLASCCCCS